MRKIKIAQIGTSHNSHGDFIFKSLVKQSDIFEVAGYAMPENEKEKFKDHMAVFSDYKEMTVEEIMKNPEIESVTIETEEIHLTKYAKMAAQYGKHIHMEKPGGTVLADFEELIDIVKNNKTVFHIGYMYRYNPCVKELMEKVKNGELGEIISVEAQMNSCYPTISRQWLENFKGGMMFFLGCHLIDIILQIKGTPENIIPLNCCTGVKGVTSEDFGMAVLQYKNGVSFAKTTADEFGGFMRRQIVVIGTKGTVEIKPLEIQTGGRQYTKMTICKDTDRWDSSGETKESPVYARFDDMMASFASMVRGEKENPWTYDYELELYKTILKACGCK